MSSGYFQGKNSSITSRRGQPQFPVTRTFDHLPEMVKITGVTFTELRTLALLSNIKVEDSLMRHIIQCTKCGRHLNYQIMAHESLCRSRLEVEQMTSHQIEGDRHTLSRYVTLKKPTPRNEERGDAPFRPQLELQIENNAENGKVNVYFMWSSYNNPPRHLAYKWETLRTIMKRFSRQDIPGIFPNDILSEDPERYENRIIATIGRWKFVLIPPIIGEGSTEQSRTKPTRSDEAIDEFNDGSLAALSFPEGNNAPGDSIDYELADIPGTSSRPESDDELEDFPSYGEPIEIINPTGKQLWQLSQLCKLPLSSSTYEAILAGARSSSELPKEVIAAMQQLDSPVGFDQELTFFIGGQSFHVENTTKVYLRDTTIGDFAFEIETGDFSQEGYPRGIAAKLEWEELREERLPWNRMLQVAGYRNRR